MGKWYILVPLLCGFLSKRRFILIYYVLANFPVIILGQGLPSDSELGLHGQVTWVSDSKVRVEYDWSNDAQLLDWTTTNGSSLVRENGFVIISGGATTSVWAMIWKKGIKCSRIFAKDAIPLTSSGHLNFYSNLTSFDGNFLPNPGLGAVLLTTGNFWTHDGAQAGSIEAPILQIGVARDYDFTISPTGMSIQSSINNVIYSYNFPSVLALDRKIALGGWSGNTRWGKIIIEGEVTTPWQFDTMPSDVINIQSYGSVFAPIIEVVGTPIIEWIFDDSSISASVAPVKNYASEGSRHNYLKVTPWSALIGINIGYDSSDGGYGGFEMVENQNVLGFRNLSLAKHSLQYICASYNLLTELDLRGLSALKFVELFQCPNLVTLRLDSHPVLERLCVENCNLDSLNLSGCSALEDLRASTNNYSIINWDSVGQSIWHICIRDNPKINVNLPVLNQFPVLRDLWIWNTNQNGELVCHSSAIQEILASENHYVGADLKGCSGLRILDLSSNQLTFFDIGSANSLIDVELKDCGLAQSKVDYILLTLDKVNLSNGNLDLTGNAIPSTSSIVHYNNLIGKGWTISITNPEHLIPVTGIAIAASGGTSAINSNSGTLQLNAEIFPVNATIKTVTWSIVSGSGLATVDHTGLVTAIGNGTIRVRGTANDGSETYNELIISISNQVSSIDIDYPSIGKVIVTINELRILLSQDFTSWQAKLFGFQGILVSSKLVESDILSFDISRLPPGIYIVVLSRGNNTRVVKVIKP